MVRLSGFESGRGQLRAGSGDYLPSGWLGVRGHLASSVSVDDSLAAQRGTPCGGSGLLIGPLDFGIGGPSMLWPAEDGAKRRPQAGRRPEAAFNGEKKVLTRQLSQGKLSRPAER